MKHVARLVVFGFILFSASGAWAENIYFSTQIGFVMVSDTDNTLPLDPADNFELETDLGFNIGGAVGIRLGQIRAEFEIAHREGGADRITEDGMVEAVDGDLTSLSFMVNGFYDLDLAGPVTPYLGFGIGLSSVSVDLLELDQTIIVDDSETVFAYQIILGAGVDISENWTLTAGYRYFATADSSLVQPDGEPLNSEFQSHEFRFGVRYWLD